MGLTQWTLNARSIMSKIYKITTAYILYYAAYFMQAHNLSLSCDFRCFKNLIEVIEIIPNNVLVKSRQSVTVVGERLDVFYISRNFAQSCLLDCPRIGRFCEFEAYQWPPRTVVNIKLKNFILVSYLKISIWLPVTVSPIHVKIF